LLRNQEGLSKKNIGMGNEKAVNQFIAHHSVIFKPEQRLMWVSTHPYQLGQYVCYDLEKIFDEAESMDIKKEIIIDSLTIPADSFLFSVRYQNFEKYKKMAQKLKNNPTQITQSDIEQFLSLNPEYFHTYELTGDYYAGTGNKEKSADFYNFALSKEISSATERRSIIKKLSKLNGDSRNREKK
jgi:hypothetical protein